MGRSILARAEHKLYINSKRKRLKNVTPTIISNNCLGGIISHDLGIQFNSPFVNIGFTGGEYIRLLKNLEYYLSLSPVLLNRNTNVKGALYPLVQLGDILFLFAHERDAEKAIGKWEKRKERVNLDNAFFLFTESYECNYDDIKEFDSLPFENKVVITHKPYPEFKSAYYLKGFEDKEEVGVLSDWKPGFWNRRYIDDFDYVTFLNGKGIKRK